MLIGHLGKDPEVRHLESGAVVAQFSMATSESYKDKSGEWKNITEWHNIVAWRGLAEAIEKNLKKGNLVYLEGKITTRKWQDKDGNDRYSTDIVANTYRKLDKKEDSGYFPTADNEPKKTSFVSEKSSAVDVPSATTLTSNATPDVKKVSAPEDDLPF